MHIDPHIHLFITNQRIAAATAPSRRHAVENGRRPSPISGLIRLARRGVARRPRPDRIGASNTTPSRPCSPAIIAE